MRRHKFKHVYYLDTDSLANARELVRCRWCDQEYYIPFPLSTENIMNKCMASLWTRVSRAVRGF